MFRFTIRDLLRLMVVVAMGVGWWVDHRRLVTRPSYDEMQVWKFRAEFLADFIKENAHREVKRKTTDDGGDEVEVVGWKRMNLNKDRNSIRFKYPTTGQEP